MAGIKAFIRNGHAEGVDAAVVCEPEENQLCTRQKEKSMAAGSLHAAGEGRNGSS